MTILDLIKKSAITLNINEVLQDTSLDGVDASTEETILSNNFTLKRLFEFSKIVLNEVASYAPQLRQVKAITTNKTISLNEVGDVAKIVAVKDEYSYVKYALNNGVIELDKDGTYEVIFQQRPQTDSLLSEVDMTNIDASEDLFVYGLNSYYCLATGLFAEYNVYNASYVDKLARVKNLKLFAMPCRSWND